MRLLFELPRATWLIYRMHLATILGSRRSLSAIGLAAVPPLLAFLAGKFAPDQRSAAMIFGTLGVFLLIQFIVPMLSVALGVGVIADEAEARTITYPFTRPIPRPALFLGRWLASLTAILSLVAASSIFMALLLEASGRAKGPDPVLVKGVVMAALVGGLVYSIGAAVIGAVFKRGLVFALGYVFAVESLLSFVPGSTQKLTVQYHLRSMFIDKEDRVWRVLEELELIEFLDPQEAMVKMLVVSGALLVLGCVVVERKQFVLSS